MLQMVFVNSCKLSFPSDQNILTSARMLLKVSQSSQNDSTVKEVHISIVTWELLRKKHYSVSLEFPFRILIPFLRRAESFVHVALSQASKSDT